MNYDLSYPSENLESRIEKGKKLFESLYSTTPQVVSRAPGRAEVIGNHTDYNNGYALTCGITKSTLTFAARRSDRKVRVASTDFGISPVEFSLDKLSYSGPGEWTNYIKGIFDELMKVDDNIMGADILIESTVPSSGGVSSSAALELSLAASITHLFYIEMSPVDLSFLCKKAENGLIVQVPCGFLDQAASGLSQKDHLLFLDFEPKGDFPVSRIDQIELDLEAYDASFIVVVDKSVKRNLGSSGYPARRAMCEKSVPLIGKILSREIKTLRDISIQEFEKCRVELDGIDPVMRKRVEHIVYENQRVLDSIEALRNKNLQKFGQILTESGKSALELYELDEKTPELTRLVTAGREIDGVYGMRNMGGGFSAIALALIPNEEVNNFEKSLDKVYGPGLEYIPFSLSQGAVILE